MNVDEVFHVCGQVINGIEYKSRISFARHGIDSELQYHLLRVVLVIIAIVGGGAVKDGSRNVSLLISLLEDGLGTVEAVVVAGVATDVCDLISSDVGDVGEICVI